MAEEIQINGNTREEKYQSLWPQMIALTEGENDLTANLANTVAAIKQTFDFFWIGFYLVKFSEKSNSDELVLGPFQGPIACTRISKGKGVCGTSWERSETLIVPDVDAFPGHIACSSASRSEIVIPVIKNGKVVAVLDVDSDLLNDFNETDKIYLEKICLHVSGFFE